MIQVTHEQIEVSVVIIVTPGPGTSATPRWMNQHGANAYIREGATTVIVVEVIYLTSSVRNE